MFGFARPLNPYGSFVRPRGWKGGSAYGDSTKLAVEIAYHSNYGEVAPVIARWENSEYSYYLIRTGQHASFALILNLKRLDSTPWHGRRLWRHVGGAC